MRIRPLIGAALAAALLTALITGGVACDAPPAPRQRPDDFLARRRMTHALVALAERAAEAGDVARELAAYTLLVDLWPDLPEARTGGEWHRAAHRLRVLRDQRARERRLHDRARALQTRLTLSARQLELMRKDLERVLHPTPAATPTPHPATWTSPVLDAAVAGALGALSPHPLPTP